MRYIDTGSRDPGHALGTWLSTVLDPAVVLELRWQSGFYSGDVLGLFAPTLAKLAMDDGTLRVLVGSNDGQTPRSDVQTLVDLAGVPRSGASVGVVAFADGFFHPKVVHLRRRDGTSAAYIGSANLTGSGVASLHVEAGMLIDTMLGDPVQVLDSVASTIDWWFSGVREGLSLINGANDLDQLVLDGILDVPRPDRPRRPIVAQDTAPGPQPRLHKLVTLPGLPRRNVPAVNNEPQPPQFAPVVVAAAPRGWQNVWRSNALSERDLNVPRGPTTNKTGSMTLRKGDWDMEDQRHFFRDQVFRDLDWYRNPTQGRAHLELAEGEFEVVVRGVSLGSCLLTISHNTDTTSATYLQNNAMTHLRWGSALPWVSDSNLLGEILHLDREVNPPAGVQPKYRVRIGN